MHKLDERGYLTFAIGESYLRMAYAQCLSIKLAMPDALYAVIVDEATASFIDDRHMVFDYIIRAPKEMSHPMAYEHMALSLSPFRETIKLDADVYFPGPVDHWWNVLRLKDVCFTTKVYDHRQNLITRRDHRELFDLNQLPDVYTAFWYFRYSQTAIDLFSYAKQITNNWDWYANEFLIGNVDSQIRTDELFAISAMAVGVDKVTLCGSVPSFTHMKEPLIGVLPTANWTEQLYTSGCPQLDVGFNPQHRPFHYYRKEWLTDDRIRELEHAFRSNGTH